VFEKQKKMKKNAENGKKLNKRKFLSVAFLKTQE
jgi:hypothetical protein